MEGRLFMRCCGCSTPTVLVFSRLMKRRNRQSLSTGTAGVLRRCNIRPRNRANGDSCGTHNPNRYDCEAWQQGRHHPSERSKRYQFLSESRSASWTCGNRCGRSETDENPWEHFDDL